MRILVLTAFYPPHQIGGYEIRCKEVVDDLVKRGHEAFIITTRCPTRQCDLLNIEYSIARVLHPKKVAQNTLIQIRNDLIDLRFIDQILKAYQPDIIYLWSIQPLSNAIFPYFTDQNIQIVYDEGGSGLIYLTKIHEGGLYFFKNKNDPSTKRWLKKVLNRMLNWISSGLIKPQWSWPNDMRVYFNSKSALRYSQERGAQVKTANVIYSGIMIAHFPFHPRDQTGSPVKIITPGRIKPKKGNKDAVYLMSELRKREIDARLIIVGKVELNEYYDEILQEIFTNGLVDFIEYSPMVSQRELAHLYQESEFCLVPTYFKTGFSRVPLEAMASGCIVITYGNEGSGEIIDDSHTGFIVPEGDISAAADLIEDLINDPSRYRQISRNARLKIENECSFDKYVDAIEAYLYESLQKNAQRM